MKDDGKYRNLCLMIDLFPRGEKDLQWKKAHCCLPTNSVRKFVYTRAEELFGPLSQTLYKINPKHNTLV